MSEGRAPSVIIADNNAFYRELVGDFYRDLGFQTQVAGDGLEALEQLRVERFDLVVLDLIMPRIDGAQACRMIKKSDEFGRIPVIILSGILADEIEDVDSIGADAYIAKMRFEDVQEALRQATREVMCRKSGHVPLVYGFERMYRREVVLELLQEARRRQTVFESLSEGTVELSEGRRVLMTNQAFRNMVGMPEAALLSRRLEDLFPQNKAVLQSLFDQLEKEPGVASAAVRCAGREFGLKLHSFAHVSPVVSQAATERHIMSSADPGPLTTVREGSIAERTHADGVAQTVEEGAKSGFTLLVEDITERVRAEREREHLRVRLNQNEKMSAVGLFVSGAAHELNNPLTTVLGYAELLLADAKEGAPRRELEKIVDGAKRCKTILLDLMSFTRRTRPEMSRIDLALLLPEVALAYQDRLAEIGGELDLAVDPDMPSITADPAQLRQTVGLVMDNAVKALAEVPSGEKMLTINASHADGTITIRVSDTGPGIPERALGKLFDPFFTTREVGQGQGLGLSVAYGIVSAHGGRIAATNKPSGGAVVTIQLPVDPPEKSELARSEGTTALRRRILVVDDEAVVAELLADILESQEHQIDIASNGCEGLDRIRECSYDAIILDLRMPDMNGQQMYELMAREMPAALDRLMFITADTVTPEVERFLEEVGRPCLTKPFSVRDLLETVETILP